MIEIKTMTDEEKNQKLAIVQKRLKEIECDKYKNEIIKEIDFLEYLELEIFTDFERRKLSDVTDSILKRIKELEKTIK